VSELKRLVLRRRVQHGMRGRGEWRRALLLNMKRRCRAAGHFLPADQESDDAAPATWHLPHISPLLRRHMAGLGIAAAWRTAPCAAPTPAVAGRPRRAAAGGTRSGSKLCGGRRGSRPTTSFIQKNGETTTSTDDKAMGRRRDETRRGAAPVPLPRRRALASAAAIMAAAAAATNAGAANAADLKVGPVRYCSPRHRMPRMLQTKS
jgi:hypothetical protein